MYVVFVCLFAGWRNFPKKIAYCFVLSKKDTLFQPCMCFDVLEVFHSKNDLIETYWSLHEDLYWTFTLLCHLRVPWSDFKMTFFLQVLIQLRISRQLCVSVYGYDCEIMLLVTLVYIQRRQLNFLLLQKPQCWHFFFLMLFKWNIRETAW